MSDDTQRLCLALAAWNDHAPIVKERLCGLTNAEGNHGEDGILCRISVHNRCAGAAPIHLLPTLLILSALLQHYEYSGDAEAARRSR